jgi:hypothetical protein
MALLAITYGLIAQHSIWYPINLLAAGFFPETGSTTAQLSAFQPYSDPGYRYPPHYFPSVGLLYGAMLPMLSRRPILLGGVIAPILWSGLIHSFLEIVDSVLNKRISWPWFVVSQVGFGIVAGIIVAKQQRIHTWQHLPFAIRAGLEAPGAMEETDGEDRRQ